MPGLIAHEWIEPVGGSENVLEAIAAAFPDADLVTPWTNAPERFPGRQVRELWLSRSPLRHNKALAMPALALAWRSAVPADRPYDWVLASSHSFAHHIRPRGASDGAPKLVYAYTPARYLWTPELDDRGSRLAARMAAPLLRGIDRRRSREATSVAGISRYVAARIKATWGADATVIHPPVEVERLQSVADWRGELTGDELARLDALPERFILGASRFIPYKRLDVAIRAGAATGMPVVIAGAGPLEGALRSAAAASDADVRFVIAPSNAMLFALYQRADVLVFPPIEDFGIVPVEAIAVGTPVVAAAEGGSAETVADGVSGVHVRDWSDSELRRAIERVQELEPSAIRNSADRFSRARFDRELRAWVASSTGATRPVP